MFPSYSLEHPWVDLATFVHVTAIVFQDVLSNNVTTAALVLALVRLLVHLLPAKALTRDEYICLATSPGLVLTRLWDRPIRGVIDRLLNIVLSSHNPVFVVDMSLAQFVVPAGSL